MRVRYSRRPGQDADGRDYEVRTQERPRARWVRRGLVSGFGARNSQWAALGDDAPAWTRYRATRAAAVADMLAGRTFLDNDPRGEAKAMDPVLIKHVAGQLQSGHGAPDYKTAAGQAASLLEEFPYLVIAAGEHAQGRGSDAAFAEYVAVAVAEATASRAREGRLAGAGLTEAEAAAAEEDFWAVTPADWGSDEGEEGSS
jgi:hypothetical protein